MKKIKWDVKEQPELKCCEHCNHFNPDCRGDSHFCEHPTIVKIYPDGYARIVGVLDICSLYEEMKSW